MTEQISVGAFGAEHLETAATDLGTIIEPEYIQFLRSQGYKIESISQVKYAHSGESDTAHIMVEVTTHRYPQGDERLDVVADTIQIRACDCWDYRQNSPDVSDHDTSPDEYQTCKHIRSAFREEKAEADGQQATL